MPGTGAAGRFVTSPPPLRSQVVALLSMLLAVPPACTAQRLYLWSPRASDMRLSANVHLLCVVRGGGTSGAGGAKVASRVVAASRGRRAGGARQCVQDTGAAPLQRSTRAGLPAWSHMPGWPPPY